MGSVTFHRKRDSRANVSGAAGWKVWRAREAKMSYQRNRLRFPLDDEAFFPTRLFGRSVGEGQFSDRFLLVETYDSSDLRDKPKHR